MTSLLPDLAACANEPIRVPGAIQPHGWLLVLDREGRALACSENAPLAADFCAALFTKHRDDLLALRPGEAPAFVGTQSFADGLWDFAAHASGDTLILEFEPAASHPALQAPIYSLARRFLPQLHEARDITELAQLAADEIKRLTGFGRSLVYRFDAEGHGEVLAEACDPGYESYLGHWFPASDIPPQARQLYCLNHMRLIPDAYYQPAALRALVPDLDPRSIDLGFAALRSVSPVHVEFMRNMGTLASMSVSLVVHGRLWGMISCHHAEARHVELPIRIACEHMGRMLSLQIAAQEQAAEAAARLELRQLTLELVSSLKNSDSTLQRLIDVPALLRLVRASGAAVVLDDRCWIVGEAPEAAPLQTIAQWVIAQGTEVLCSDQLWQEHPELPPIPGIAGLLAISLSRVHRHLVLWFRPEFVRTIQWAGEPGKIHESEGRLHPRRSFATWQEEVRGRSLPWSSAERAAALELRHALVDIVLRRAEEMAQLSEELAQINRELEAFSYTVSHDLRAPSRHIAAFTDLVLEADGHALSERSRRHLRQVKEAATVAAHLVDALLDFSRLGRLALHKVDVDAQQMVEELIAELQSLADMHKVSWEVVSPLPRLWGDAFLLKAATRNLLANAVKYSRTRDEPRIRIAPVTREDASGLEISDNGVGFEQKYVDKLFGVFQRLHKTEEFEGTGIGLANVRRIVDRHGGSVWAEGVKDQGAKFGFVVPRRGKDV